jgi:hypothetical protein
LRGPDQRAVEVFGQRQRRGLCRFWLKQKVPCGTERCVRRCDRPESNRCIGSNRDWSFFKLVREFKPIPRNGHPALRHALRKTNC